VKENLSCEACERELIALIDGALTPAVARVVERHAESCARCGAALRDYRALASRLQALPLLAPPPGLEDRIVRKTLGPRFLRTGWQRLGAAGAAVSFVLSIGLVANLGRIARALGVPDPSVSFAAGIDVLLTGAASASKWLANEVVFYVPIARQIWVAVESLKSVPRVALVALRAPEVQLAGAILVTLGLALYLMLRPSRHERSVGHVCLSL